MFNCCLTRMISANNGVSKVYIEEGSEQRSKIYKVIQGSMEKNEKNEEHEKLQLEQKSENKLELQENIDGI
ncbi:hypothetical protein pb186bvf_019918 [Paramecium bursaria]